MYTQQQLPVLISQLKTSADEEEIKKCCASAAQIAQEMILPDGTNPVESVPELVDDDLLNGLINIVKNCSTNHKVAVRNALRALADISKMEAAKPKLYDLNIFASLKPYLESTAANAKQTSKKEVFSYAACTIVTNMLAQETVKQMLDFDYTNYFLTLIKSSMTYRPAVSVFAASMLRQFTALPEGTQAIIKAGGITELASYLETAVNLVESATDNKEDLISLIRFCTFLIDIFCDNQNIPTVLQTNIVPTLVRVFAVLNASVVADLSSGNITQPEDRNVSALDILLKVLNTDEGESQINRSVDMITMYFMLLRLATLESPTRDAEQQLSKLCLAIGGSFAGDESVPITASQLITLLNQICQKFFQGDSEVVFIVTSLIVHLANFPNGVDGLQSELSFQTRAMLLPYFLSQEKSEVVQSILRNECVMIQTASDSTEVIQLMASNSIFKLLKDILALYSELNSEITETVIVLLQHIAGSPEGLTELQNANLSENFTEVLNYFNNVNTTDERREPIVSALNQILELMK